MYSGQNSPLIILHRGLEQQVALPRDSYLQDYFTDLYGVLRVGPPLYFVVPHTHMDPQDPDINRICSVGGCDDTSFVNEVRSVALHASCCCAHEGHSCHCWQCPVAMLVISSKCYKPVQRSKRCATCISLMTPHLATDVSMTYNKVLCLRLMVTSCMAPK